MLNRSPIYALAAVALAGAAALAPTGASAGPMGVIIKKPVVQGVILPPHPVMGVVLHPPHPIMGVIIHPRPIGDIDPPRFWWHHHHEPVLIEGGETIRETFHETPRVSVPVASAPCNCLTKSYLQDGSVLFKDICTKESALATPDELRAQAQGIAPQVR